jgi:hypothetical protein
LDYLKGNGTISYRRVIQQGLQSEGPKAFFTVPKWFSRVLMNAPAQGTLPWFYNEVLPVGEPWFLEMFKATVYEPFLKKGEARSGPGLTTVPSTLPDNATFAGTGKLQRTRTHYATLPTANPEFDENATFAGTGKLQRTRTHYATLPTANPEFDETEKYRKR